MNLFNIPTCARCGDTAAAQFTDEWGAAWLCRAHLVKLLILQFSVGQTVSSFVEGRA